MSRQLLVMEERKTKQVADCKRIAEARMQAEKEVEALRKELQHLVSKLASCK